jgi:hypothetical protein
VLSLHGLPLPPTCVFVTVIQARSYVASTALTTRPLCSIFILILLILCSKVVQDHWDIQASRCTPSPYHLISLTSSEFRLFLKIKLDFVKFRHEAWRFCGEVRHIWGGGGAGRVGGRPAGFQLAHSHHDMQPIYHTAWNTTRPIARYTLYYRTHARASSCWLSRSWRSRTGQLLLHDGILSAFLSLCPLDDF